jgi:hypothetical protein
MTPRPVSQRRKERHKGTHEAIMYLSRVLRGRLYRRLGRLEISHSTGFSGGACQALTESLLT